MGGAPICILRLIKGENNQYTNYTVAKNEDDYLFSQFELYSQESYDIDLTRVSYSSFKSLKKIIRSDKPDLLHVHGKGGAFYGLLVKVFINKRISFVYTFHGFHFKYKGIKAMLHLLFEKAMASCMSYGVAVSDSESDYYLESIGGNPDKVVTIPNGIEIIKKELPEKIGAVVKQFSVNVVTLSRINHQKDLLSMLKAFESVGDKNVALHIMGGYIDDPYEYEMKKALDVYYEGMQMKDNVYFWGDVSEAGNLICNFDIYWSTALFEGLPTAIIEAMMSKVLVVGTNCRGNIDLINDKVTGILTKMQNVESIANGLYKALKILKETTGKEIVERAYEQSTNYSVENNVKAIVNLYNKVTDNNK